MNKCAVIGLCLLLTHCASAPKPPHCHDNGKGSQPVNTASVVLKPVEQSHE
ncbi:hypothetical protein [Parashewanella curva]|uniref:hypothetical protein n=1 Tax=Parashewanella curva TaxID=2338552 RepID=UPI0014055E6B|nr:hypothetical protein [Parashewanella curva]